MARLKASHSGDRRTAFIGANLTARERVEVERRAQLAGFRLAEFIRLSLLSDRPGAKTPPRLPGEVGRTLAVELARIGNNLNQLAHWANATGSLPAREALDRALDELVRATRALTEL